jgi:hypothetical protein
MRWWQARPISRPPPSAVPFIAATTGRPSVSSRRSWFLMVMDCSMTAGASAGVALLISSRSPPAKKVFFAEVMTTPVMFSRSATSASTHSPIAVM